jgi:hypothetical protein
MQTILTIIPRPQNHRAILTALERSIVSQLLYRSNPNLSACFSQQSPLDAPHFWGDCCIQPEVMMKRVYSTEALVQILAEEQRACMSGQRLNLAAQPSGSNHVIDQLIEPTGIQKFTAYENFRDTIHQYQHEYQVSGIVWQTVTIADRSLKFPHIDPQLVSLNQDLRVLWAAKTDVLIFWQQVTTTLALFLSVAQGNRFTPLPDRASINPLIARSEWATIAHHGTGDRLEVILQLGWGKPDAARYQRDVPASGSEFIHAVFPGREPLG